MKTLYDKKGIKVVDSNAVRGLYVDGKSQGRVHIPSFNPYSWYYKNILNLVDQMSRVKNGVHKTALILGAGPCVLTSELGLRHFKTTTVDKNGLMFDIARQYFGYDPNNDYPITSEVDKGSIKMFGEFDLAISDLWDGHKKSPVSDRMVFDECVNEGGLLISNHGDNCRFLMESQ